MSKLLYLINPPSDFPTHFGSEAFAASGLAPACLVADLATATVAALASPYLDVKICEASVEPVDYDIAADYVGITGKVNQFTQMLIIAREFRARGKTVIIGGPYASLCPLEVRGECDILFRGELEGIADEFFSNLRDATWKPEYNGGQPDIRSSPMPRWDLYPNDRSLVGSLQTSRGCPFECEFCDVIQYLGRKQRFKSIEQILTELDHLHRLGYRRIFLCDDNFTVSRKRAKQVLAALRQWNEQHCDSPCTFDTQASIEVGEDEELLHMCVEAGLTSMFVGIETPNADSLRETKKFQNLRQPVVESINKIVEHGIAIRGGMIVGFDSDGPDIFQRMFDFAMSTPIPFYNLGALVALETTPLHSRLKREGRLFEGNLAAARTTMQTNIDPKQMTREQLLQGVKWLGNQLYRPAAFAHRINLFKATYGIRRRTAATPRLGFPIRRSIYRDAMKMVKHIRRLGANEDAMIREIFSSLSADPDTNMAVMESLINYVQVRHLYSKDRFWNEHLPEHYEAAVSPSAAGLSD